MNCWVDTHCHLNYDKLSDHLDAVVKRANEAGVGRLVTINTSLLETDELEKISNTYDCVKYTVGHHPCETDLQGEQVYEKLNAYLSVKRKSLVGIGEAGLDINNPNFNQQKEVFHAHLEQARKHNLPVIVHSREMDKELLASLKEFSDVQGVLHCWTGQKETALEAIDIGWMVSFSGILTFKKKVEYLWEQAQELPLDRLVIETDAPFLAPQLYRGKTNEPSYVVEVAKKLAELRCMQLDKLQEILYQNSCVLFKSML